MFLRLVIGVTFLWAGFGKLQANIPVKGEDAAVLANLGVIERTPPPPPADGPRNEIPSPMGAAPSSGGPFVLAQDAPKPTSVTAPAPRYTADDFADPVEVKRMWGIALRVHHSAHPPMRQDGSSATATWPKFIGEGLWPKYLAISVVCVEVICGAAVLFGLLTRISAFLLAGVMIGAIWLDQCTPAMQAGKTVLFILPDHGMWDVAAWRPLLWQLSLLASCLALSLLGAGVMSFDRAVGALRGSRPKPAAPAPGGGNGGGPRGKV